MYLRKIRLKDVKCFEDAELGFVDENDEIIRWTVILGENGTGKSTILRSIALLLAGSDASKGLEHEPRNMVRSGCMEGIIDAEVELSDKKRALKIGMRFLNKHLSEGWGALPGDDREIFEELLHEDYGRGNFVCGYGAVRIAAWGERIVQRGYPEKHQDPRIDRLQTLFNEEMLLGPANERLVGRGDGLRGIRSEGIHTDELRLKNAVETLSDILPSVTLKEINPDGVAIFNTPYGEGPLSELSRGYRDILTWVTDLMRHLIDAFPDSDDPLQERGVVLIEGIMLHLHPIWQQKVIDFLREKFPNLQFIVSTHSPLAAQSLNQNELVVLKRVEGKDKQKDTVSIDRFDLAPKSMSVDQILTSPVFGLTSAKSLEVQEKMGDFTKIKRKILRGEATENEEHRYRGLTRYFEEVHEAPGESFAQRDQFIRMENILRKLGREDLLEYPPIEALKSKRKSSKERKKDSGVMR